MVPICNQIGTHGIESHGEAIYRGSDLVSNVSRKRFPIALPSWHEKRLIWWAHVKGASKTSLAQNILQARIEANDQQVQQALAEIAADEGVSLEELKNRLLEGTSLNTIDEPL
jgi:predicted DsbA family dithiol-disulfide isomerase